MTAYRTPFTERLGIRYPLLQDGMGGGALGTGRLAAAVSNAGALGSLSTPGSTVGAELDRIMRDQIELALSLTEEPLAVNIPVGTDSAGNVLQYTRDILEIGPPVAEIVDRIVTQAHGLLGRWATVPVV